MGEERLSRRDRDKLRQRQEMLGAALTLFSEKGYHNVSMQEIAETAEFSIGTLYKFFKNKEALYKYLILEQADRFHAAFRKALAETDDEIEKLRNYVRVKGFVFMGSAPTIRLYFAETRGASFNIKVGLDNEIREQYDLILQDLAKIFAAGIKKGLFQKIAEPYHLAVALDCLSNAFLHLWLETPEQHAYPQDPDKILNIFFKGLIPS